MTSRCTNQGAAWQKLWNKPPETYQHSLRSEQHTDDPVDAEHFAITYDRHTQGNETPIADVIDRIHHYNNHSRGPTRRGFPRKNQVKQTCRL